MLLSKFDSFLGNKGQFKDFCVQKCLQKYEQRHFGKPIEDEVAPCAVCSNEKAVEAELIIDESKSIKLCSDPCLGAYKFGNNLTDTIPCDLCKRELPRKSKLRKNIYYGGKSATFCSEACQNVFVMQTREIVPCSWCKVRKYNFDMIEKFLNGLAKHFCSVNCFKLLSSNGTQGAG